MFKLDQRVKVYGNRNETIPATITEISKDKDGETIYKCVYDEEHPVYGPCFDWLYSFEIAG